MFRYFFSSGTNFELFIGANPHEDFVRRIAKYDTHFKAAEPTLHEPTRSRVMRRAAYVHMCA